jgi:hypothetical protein
MVSVRNGLRYLRTISVTSFGMSGSEGIKLTELFQIIYRQLIAKQMQQNVLQSAAVLIFSGILDDYLPYLRMAKKVIN